MLSQRIKISDINNFLAYFLPFSLMLSTASLVNGHPNLGLICLTSFLPLHGWAVPAIRRPCLASSQYVTCNGHSTGPTQFSRNKGWIICPKIIFPIQSCKYLIPLPLSILRVWKIKDHKGECFHSWPSGDSKGKSHSKEWLLRETQTETVRDSCDRTTMCQSHKRKLLQKKLKVCTSTSMQGPTQKN